MRYTKIFKILCSSTRSLGVVYIAERRRLGSNWAQTLQLLLGLDVQRMNVLFLKKNNHASGKCEKSFDGREFHRKKSSFSTLCDS